MAKIAKGRNVVTKVGKQRHVKGVWTLSEESEDKGVRTRLLKQEFSPAERLALRRFSWEAEGG